MTLPSNFTTQVFRKDKTIKISTLSPNGKFFYRIKEPKDIYWGLFCSPIAFYNNDGNLIYHNKSEYAQFGLTRDKPWEIVSWATSGSIAFFIERNSTKTLYYTLLDLEQKKVCKIKYQDNDEEKWTSELFSKLPADKAQEAHYKIISTPKSKSSEAFDYVLTLNLIDDKRELIKALEQYYFSDFKKALEQLENGNFDDDIIKNSLFNNLKNVLPDKVDKGTFEFLGLDKWRP